jgi:hypothetical protein
MGDGFAALIVQMTSQLLGWFLTPCLSSAAHKCERRQTLSSIVHCLNTRPVYTAGEKQIWPLIMRHIVLVGSLSAHALEAISDHAFTSEEVTCLAGKSQQCLT